MLAAGSLAAGLADSTGVEIALVLSRAPAPPSSAPPPSRSPAR
jgi:hypothetical protein